MAGDNKSPTAAIRSLVEPIKNTSRNITIDRCHTPIDLADELYSLFGLTTAVALQIIRKHVPIVLKIIQEREWHS